MASTTTIELSPLHIHEQLVLGSEHFGSRSLQGIPVEPLQESDVPHNFSKGRSAAIILTVAGVNFLNTLGSGTLTVALPQIAKDLALPREILLW